MVVQIVELGPFGSRINRGRVENIEDVPECYKVMSLKTTLDCIVVYVEPEK